jgi:hypothetical protein
MSKSSADVTLLARIQLDIDSALPKKQRINSLLIGDPGLVKTTLLEKTLELVPNSQYAGGQSSTGLSLTAQISKEDGGSYNLRYGPVVLAKGSIDLIKVFEKLIVRDNVFEGRYRTTSLDAVSSALLGIRKYRNLNASSENMSKIPIPDQKKYVRRDAELVMLLAQYNNCLVLRLMKVFAGYAEMDYYKVLSTISLFI